MIDRRDPEYHDVRRARMDNATRRFRMRLDSEDVYRASLFALGYRGAEIHAEVVANWPDPINRPMLLTTVGVR